MYIEIHNYEKMEQDILYFKLTNAFNMDKMEKMNAKIAGIYAIYKDDRCVYVGQSINLASRIATHLRGPYATATSVFCWEAENLYYDKFKYASKDEKKVMLDNAEKYIMAKFKPVENLMIDMDFKLLECDTPEVDTCFGGDIRIQIIVSGMLVVSNRDSLAFGLLKSSIEESHFYEKIDSNVCNEIFGRVDHFRLIKIDSEDESVIERMEAI